MLPLLLQLLIGPAFADDTGDSQLLHRAVEQPPPTSTAASAVVNDLLERIRQDNVTEEWLRATLLTPALPTAPRAPWITSWRLTLSMQRPVGAALASTEGVALVTQGPAYQRVLLQGASGLTVVVVRDAKGKARIHRIERSTCRLCGERSRFVRDLLDDVGRRGDQSHRLTPHIELHVADHMRQAGLYGDWVGILQQRNRTGGVLSNLLRDARVTAVVGDVVEITYGDDTVDTWQVHWLQGRWQVRYDGLADDSPLRMSRTQSERWRSRDTQKASAQTRWSPRWQEVGRGAGLLIGDRAVDAIVDPRDGTVLVVVMDMDRVLAGIYRVDPETRQVLERIHLPAPDPRTQFPSQAWFAAWHAALSPDARTMAVTGPNRVWSVDLVTGQARTVTRGAVQWLSWTSLPPSGDPLLAVGSTDTLWLFGQGPVARLTVPGTIEAGWATPTGGMCLTTEGTLWNLDLEAKSAEVCCGAVASAAWREDGGAMLASCGSPCDVAAVLVKEGNPPMTIPGAGVQHRGASLSPNGQWFTTGTAAEGGAVLLWHSDTQQPVARLPVKPVQHVRWARGSSVILTVGMDGDVHWWDLDEVRRLHSLR